MARLSFDGHDQPTTRCFTYWMLGIKVTPSLRGAEEDDPGERRETPERARELRKVPCLIDVRDLTDREHQVDRAITEDLAGDVNAAQALA